MPDDVKEMLGLPVAAASTPSKYRAKSETRLSVKPSQNVN